MTRTHAHTHTRTHAHTHTCTHTRASARGAPIPSRFLYLPGCTFGLGFFAAVGLLFS